MNEKQKLIIMCLSRCELQSLA